MKLIHKNIDKHNNGKVVLVAEESEDMWHAFNLITEGCMHFIIIISYLSVIQQSREWHKINSLFCLR